MVVGREGMEEDEMSLRLYVSRAKRIHTCCICQMGGWGCVYVCGRGGGEGCTNFNERVGPPLIKEPNYG